MLVPIEYWHMRMYFSQEELDAMSGKVCGMTLITPAGFPLGFGGVYFAQNDEGHDVGVAFFFGGPNQIFVRKYRKLALRGMKRVFDACMQMGVVQVYACVDKNIEKSENLVRWLGAKPTGAAQEEGEICVITLAETPLARLRE